MAEEEEAAAKGTLKASLNVPVRCGLLPLRRRRPAAAQCLPLVPVAPLEDDADQNILTAAHRSPATASPPPPGARTAGGSSQQEGSTGRGRVAQLLFHDLI